MFSRSRQPGTRLVKRLRGDAGQGTVEYVGLILLVALLMVGMVAAMKGFQGAQGLELAETIVDRIREADLLIREQVPDFHKAPVWESQRNTARRNCRDTRGEIQNAILDDIVSALRRLAPAAKVPKSGS